MGFKMIYWTPMSALYFLKRTNLKNVKIIGKTAVFPGGYGWIGEIPHGWIWPDWGL